MILPLMPKGVEHSHAASGCARHPRVILPLMPKGVEHERLAADEIEQLRVILPLMPKGVEQRVIVPRDEQGIGITHVVPMVGRAKDLTAQQADRPVIGEDPSRLGVAWPLRGAFVDHDPRPPVTAADEQIETTVTIPVTDTGPRLIAQTQDR